MRAGTDPGGERPYHHGALRAALLEAAERELEENGIEAFSLRRVARRAGVSHAAPAHHFGDARGLLTALAAVGFRRFLEAQARREASAAAEPRELLLAAARGYVDFAAANPALFRLMFGSDRPDYDDAGLQQAARAAFDHLVGQVSDVLGRPAMADEEGLAAVATAWGLAHGIADLGMSGRMRFIERQEPEVRERLLSAVLKRTVPGA